MGSVYSSSASAFIWLGPGNEESDRALNWIDSLQLIRSKHIAQDAKEIGPYNIKFPENMVTTTKDQAGLALEAIFSRPWFHRSWTFQEPIRAPARMIACGSKILGWDTFVNALVPLVHLKCREETVVRANPSLTIQSFINKKQKREDLRLSQLIYRTWKRQASDPRDRVYALYGLVQSYQKVPLVISYDMSIEDVYRSTVRFCIENEGSLSILTYVSKFRNQSDLPSWVPDWRDRSDSGCRAVSRSDFPKFYASSMSRPLPVPSSSNDKLILKGFILAIVDHTIDIAALKVNATDSFPESWITNAAAAGVPMRFLQGKAFQTSYDITILMENSPFHSEIGELSGAEFWANSNSWIAAGQPGPVPQAVITEYKKEINHRIHNRRLFLTKDFLGLAPAPTQVGDIVCILLGGSEPFILRPRLDTARTTHDSRKSARVAKQALETTEWTLIGDCYLHGHMHGEAMETVTEADYVNFTLV